MGEGDNFGWFVGVVDGKGNIAIDGRGDVVVRKIDKPQIGVRSRRPVRMVLLVCVMETMDLVKTALHPASQSWPMERREVLPSAGKRCAWHADGGS